MVSMQSASALGYQLSAEDPLSSLYDQRPHRDVWMELPVGAWDVERPLLPAGSRPVEGLRRAGVLRRTLQHRRSELDLLRPASRQGFEQLGRADAARLRVLDPAVS